MKLKEWLVLAMVAGWGWVSSGQALLPEGARIEFETPVHDFGRLEPGQVVKHDFVFKNTGTATLEILDVRPGCGCTTSGGWDRKVEPGSTGRIPIQFNAGSFSGPIAKGITVTCNDPARSNVFLQLKANVWAPITLSPVSAYFMMSSDSVTSDVRVVRITSNLDEPLTLDSVESTNKVFRGELKTITPGKEFDLLVSAVPPFASTHVSGSLVVKTSSKAHPEVKVPAYVMVQPAVTVSPSAAMIPAAASGAARKIQVTVRNTGKDALVVSEATTDLPGGEVQVNELQAGRLFRMVITLPEGQQLEPGKQFQASFKTSHPDFPVMRVPLLQAQRSIRPPAATPRPAATPLPPVPGAVTPPSAPARP